jgi:hypothetical protein
LLSAVWYWEIDAGGRDERTRAVYVREYCASYQLAYMITPAAHSATLYPVGIGQALKLIHRRPQVIVPDRGSWH